MAIRLNDFTNVGQMWVKINHKLLLLTYFKNSALPSFFPINSMNEKDRKEVPSTSAYDGISTFSNVKRHARSSRICKKCGRSVKNLSRHQEEVHCMSKLRRKLHGYLTGEKKAPNRRVKFCPLSPCKRSKTPLF